MREATLDELLSLQWVTIPGARFDLSRSYLGFQLVHTRATDPASRCLPLRTDDASQESLPRV